VYLHTVHVWRWLAGPARFCRGGSFKLLLSPLYYGLNAAMCSVLSAAVLCWVWCWLCQVVPPAPAVLYWDVAADVVCWSRQPCTRSV
jgi:hypothetical protein